MPYDWISGKWGHLWRTRHPKKIVWFQHTQVCHVQRVSKDKWAKYEPVQMPLAGSSPVVLQWQDGSKHWFAQIKYPKNSLFWPDKWAPAPPGDWYTRGEVRSGTACSESIHVQVYTCSHGTHLNVKHAFWFAPSSHTVYIPCSWEHMQGLLEPSPPGLDCGLASAVPRRAVRGGADPARAPRPREPDYSLHLVCSLCAGVRQSFLKVYLLVWKRWKKFTVLPKKFTSEVTKQQKKFTLMQKKFTFTQKKVYISDEKDYNIYQKYAEKFIWRKQSEPR